MTALSVGLYSPWFPPAEAGCLLRKDTRALEVFAAKPQHAHSPM